MAVDAGYRAAHILSSNFLGFSLLLSTEGVPVESFSMCMSR